MPYTIIYTHTRMLSLLNDVKSGTREQIDSLNIVPSESLVTYRQKKEEKEKQKQINKSLCI